MLLRLAFQNLIQARRRTALLSLVDGTVTPDALPAPVVAISPDGSLWVLGAEEDRALWRFGGAGN